MSRNIHFGFNSFVNDKKRFEESKNYNSPESLLIPNHWSLDETIYFNQDNKKLKSLNRYFCNSENAIDYKNKFANDFLKRFINGVKKPIWFSFFNDENKINILKDSIKTFDYNNKNINTKSHSINIIEDKDNFSLNILRKNNIEKILFTKNNNFHLLTLFILLENTNNCSPLMLLNYEIKGRLLIEELLIQKTYLISIFKKYYNCNDAKKYKDFFVKNKSIFSEDNTIFKGRVDSFMSSESFDNFYQKFFEQFLGNFNDEWGPSGNKNFFNNINDTQNLYNYSNTNDYYLAMGDIDSGLNYLRFGDLIYYNFLGLNKYNFISGIIYGFGHELAHHISLFFINNTCNQIESKFIKDSGEQINTFVAGNTLIDREKIDGKWKEIRKNLEGEADIISYNIHLKILEDHFGSLSLDKKKEMVKNILILACGDRTNNSHADTMVRSMYIRFIPEFDKYLPQDNANYIKYLKYKNKYLALKKNLNK
jgi:hypothetical protein